MKVVHLVVTVVCRSVPPHVVLPRDLPTDLGHVCAGQDNRDQLRDGQEHPDARVHDHHGDHVVVQPVLEHREASVDEDMVPDLNLLLLEDVDPAAF